MRRVYLDNNATTPVLPEVLDAMRPYYAEHFGNASSIHHHGQETRAAVERARESVATLLPRDGRGVVDPDDLRRALRPNTKLITIMYANNETGVIQPVEEFGKICAEADVYFHTDAVQVASKIPIRVRDIGCDLVSISGHKFHAPQGVGALYVRKGTRLEPLLYGGSHERSRRAGTENVPGIVGLGKAAELATKGLAKGEDRNTAALRDRLETAILGIVKSAGVNGADLNGKS